MELRRIEGYGIGIGFSLKNRDEETKKKQFF
jgi:hypothetical protein